MHDLTPDSPDQAHRRHGSDVTSAALAIVRREAPAATLAAITENRAFIINLFGEHLAVLDAWLMRFTQDGSQLLWRRYWNHPGAGRVDTFVFLLPNGKTVEQMERKQ